MDIKEFFRTIQWRATLQIAAIRIAVASIIWPLVFFVFAGAKASEVIPLVFSAFLVFLVFVAVAIPAVGLARTNVPFIGLLALPAWLIVVADPLVKILHGAKPEWVPVEEFKLFNAPVLGVFGESETSVSGLANARARVSRPISPTGASEFAEIGTSGPAADNLADEAFAATPESIPEGSEQELYERYLAEFGRLASLGGQGEAMRAELMKISALCDGGCKIPGPYVFLARTFAKTGAVKNFETIMSTFRMGYENCASVTHCQEEIQNALFAMGKIYWDMGEEKLAFRAYMLGLTYWRQAGNVISQSAPLLPRIAFVASRMFSKNALERENDSDLGVEFLNFCEASDVDMNLAIDVSDAGRSS